MGANWNESVHWILNTVMVLAILIISIEKKYFSVLQKHEKTRVQENVIRKINLKISVSQTVVRFDGYSVQLGDSTKYDHDFIFHLASYRGQPLVTGDKYHTKKICSEFFCYSTASTESAAYFIGGEDVGGQYLSTIAEFKDDEWRKIGDLVKARSSSSSISIGDETVILGGYAKGERMLPTEVWNFKTFEQREIDPILLSGEYRFPILFLVESGYCKNNNDTV